MDRVIHDSRDDADARQAADDALHRLEALDDITRALAQAVTPDQVATAILDRCGEALGATTSTLALVERQGGAATLRLAGVTGLPAEIVQEWLTFAVDSETPLGEVVERRSAVFIETAEERARRYPGLREIGESTGSGPVAAIPLHLGGEVIAALAFTFPGESRPFPPGDRLFLSGVGFHCAAALSRARLLESEHRASRSLERALERTSWLQVLATALASAADERAVLAALSEQGLDAVDGRALLVIEPGPEAGAGREPSAVLLSVGWHDDAGGAAAALSELAARVVYGGESILIESVDHAASTDPALAAVRGAFGDAALAAVPYQVGGRAVGALVCLFAPPNPFTAEREGFLNAVAGLLGQALGRARVYESAREAEERLQAVVETAVDGIVVIDHHGVIDSVNSAIERMFGYAREELLGRNVSVLMPEPDRSGHDRYLSGYLDGDKPPRVIGIGREVMGRRKDGSLFPLTLAVSETALPGRILFTGILHDVTEAKRAEAELLAAKEAASEASRVKGRFLETISHELRTPMSAILGFSSMLIEGVHGPLGDSQADAIRRIRRSGEHLLQLIEEVLFYTALEDPATETSPARIDLMAITDAIAALVRPGAEQKGVAVAPGGSMDEPVHLVTDVAKLRRILLYLFGGAVRLANGGTVRSRFERTDTTVTIRVESPGATLSHDDLVAMWEPFHRPEHGPPGALRDIGLGLPISARLARDLGGDIRVDSGTGTGATFSLELPLAP